MGGVALFVNRFVLLACPPTKKIPRSHIFRAVDITVAFHSTKPKFIGLRVGISNVNVFCVESC